MAISIRQTGLRLALMLLAAFGLVGLTVGSAGAWSNFGGPWYSHSTITQANIEPINILVSTRGPTYNNPPQTQDDVRNVLASQGWYNNDCYDPNVTLNNTVWRGSQSTDNGNPKANTWPFSGCGTGTRNHYRQWYRIDGWDGYTWENTNYIAASMEAVKGTTRTDGAGNQPQTCNAIHCLTGDTFNNGRQGIWNSLYNGFNSLYRVKSTSSVWLGNTAWIQQEGFYYRGDGYAWWLELWP